MLLRCHPLFSYRGMHSWPPTWTWIAGLDNKHPKGEIGILRRVQESKVQPSNRCFLYMDFDDSSYLGCLLCADHAFCTQIVRVLEANLNKPIRQIGSLDISVFYKYRDEYRERVQAMLDEKSKGQEITITAPKALQCAQIIDLMQALKQSTEKAKPKQKAAPASASEKRLRQIRNTRLDSSIYSSIAPSKNGG